MLSKIIFKLKSFIKSYFLPYKPLKMGKEAWEKQFAEDHWEYLGDIKQLARYSIIVGYIDYFFDGNGSILDLGCGQGVLLQRLKNHNFSFYVGVDLSQKAIDLALKINKDKSTFICESIETYEPEQKFDLIVFNESLYYLDDPLKILMKYYNHLSQEGKLIISMWDNKERNNKLWSLIDKNFKIISDVHVQKIKEKSAWIIKIIQKQINNR